MKKLIAIFSTLFFIISTSARADLGVGISANFASIDTDGSETELTGDGEKTTASHSNDVVIPEIFVEAISDNGFAIGLAYIPARELGSKSRTDTQPTADDDNDAGTYTAKAEVKNVIQIYTDIPIGPIYAKLGATRATLKTQEKSPNGGADFQNADVNGYSYGVGYKNDLPFLLPNGYFKLEYTHTNFDEYSDIDTNGDSKVVADTEIDTVRISLGTKF